MEEWKSCKKFSEEALYKRSRNDEEFLKKLMVQEKYFLENIVFFYQEK